MTVQTSFIDATQAPPDIPADLLSYAKIAQRAETKYNLDPRRVDRALKIVSYGFVWRDDLPGCFVVRSWSSKRKKYLVNTKAHSCTCPDHKHSGQVCKHRIAAHLYSQHLKEMSKKKFNPAETLKTLGF